MTDLTLESLAERVERVEQENRNLKDELQTKKLTILDAEGQRRAGLEVSSTGVTLFLAGKDGKLLAVLAESEEGGVGLALFEPNTNFARVSMSMLRGRPGLILMDGYANQRLGLGLSEAGEPGLSLKDSKGKPLFSAP